MSDRRSLLGLAVLSSVAVLLAVSLHERTLDRSSTAQVAERSRVENDLDDPDLGPDSERRGQPSRERVPAEPPVPTDSSPSTRLVQVQSLAHLPLNHLEIRLGGGPWTECAVVSRTEDEGTIAIVPVSDRRVDLQAAGHVPQDLPADLKVVVMEPDALLLIDMEGFREKTVRVVLPRGYGTAAAREFEALGVWTFVDPGRFALAVDVNAYRTAFADSDLTFALQLSDDTELAVQVALRDGMRAHFHLPSLAGERPRAPLRLNLTSGGRPFSGPCSVEVWHLRADRPSAEHEWNFDEGRVRLIDTNLVTRVVVLSADSALPELVLDEGYRIGVYDVAGGAGVAETNHTGAPVDVELLRGLTIRARVVSDSRPLPQTIRAEWRIPADDRLQESPLGLSGRTGRWLGGDETLRVGEGGAITVRVPRRGFPGIPPRQAGPPRVVELELAAAGFDSLAREAVFDRELDLDLGILELTAKSPNFVLESHPFAGPEGLSYATVSTSASLRPGTFEIQAAETAPDGALAIFLQPADSGSEYGGLSYREFGDSSSMPFPSPPPTALVVVGQLEASGNHVPVGFRLVDASSVPRYRAVPLVERRIAIDFRPARPGVSAVILGWTWEGIHVSTKAIREALSTPRAFELERRLPRGTESFWWTWEGPDGRIWPPAGRWTGSDPDIRMTIGG